MTTMIETQLSYAHNPGESRLSGLTVGEHLHRVVTRQPDAAAIVSVHEESSHTYAQLWEDSGVAARSGWRATTRRRCSPTVSPESRDSPGLWA